MEQIHTVVLTRKSTFEMAHRLSKAQTCACNETVHGHSYEWELSLHGTLDMKTGMVLDYGLMKSLMSCVENFVDHALWIPCAYEDQYSRDKKVLVSLFEPTAEMMCLVFVKTIIEAVREFKIPNISTVVVRLSETKNTSATFGSSVGSNLTNVPCLFELIRSENER